MTETAIDGDVLMELVNDTHDRWAAGEYEAVLDDLRRAVPEARRLVNRDPTLYQGLYIGVLRNLEGRLASAERHDEELVSVQQELIEALKADHPSDRERSANRLLRLTLMCRLALAQARLDDLAAALGTVKAARAEAAAMDADPYNNSMFSATEERGKCDSLLSALLEQAGLAEESIAAMDAAVDAETEMQVDNPDRGSLPLGARYADHGLLMLRFNRPAEAETSLRGATRIFAEYHAADPADEGHRRSLAHCAAQLGRALAQLNRPGEAVAFFEQALAASRAAPNPDLDDSRAMVACRLLDVGMCLSQLGRHEEAVAVATEAAAMWRRLQQDNSPAYDARPFGVVLELLARDLVSLKRKDDAIATIAEWQALRG